MKTELPVREAMVTKVITIAPDKPVVDAAKLMVKHEIGGVVVVKDDLPVGIITEKDFLELVAKGTNLDSTKIVDVMSSPLITISPETSILEAATLMSETKTRKLPVKENEKLVGILTAEDIARVAPKEIELLIELARLKGRTSRLDFNVQKPTAGECEICGNYSDYLYDVDDQYMCGECKRQNEGEE
jgi:CBS domain-containing protein